MGKIYNINTTEFTRKGEEDNFALFLSPSTTDSAFISTCLENHYVRFGTTTIMNINERLISPERSGRMHFKLGNISRVINAFLGFAQRMNLHILENTSFQQLGLVPSSGEGRETTTQLGPL
jgi:hypothetical protein